MNQGGATSMKTYRVKLVVDAEQDIYEIYRYVASFDSPDRADRLLNELEEACAGLAEMPQRGHVPPELDRFDVRQYREIH
jgi:toxin ParE1/3/4